MPKIRAYNGHRSWDYWNVSLWINNDEALYLLARRCVSRHKSKDNAAREMLDVLTATNRLRTPDGATYNIARIKAAMVEM